MTFKPRELSDIGDINDYANIIANITFYTSDVQAFTTLVILVILKNTLFRINLAAGHKKTGAVRSEPGPVFIYIILLIRYRPIRMDGLHRSHHRQDSHLKACPVDAVRGTQDG